MTLDEAVSKGELASAIKSGKEYVTRAEHRLKLLKANQKERSKNHEVEFSWRPTLILQKGSYFGQDITVDVLLPYGVVEQQLVYELLDARRKLTALEMKL